MLINLDRNRRKAGTEDVWSEAENRSPVALFKEGQDRKAISEEIGRWNIGACIFSRSLQRQSLAMD